MAVVWALTPAHLALMAPKSVDLLPTAISVGGTGVLDILAVAAAVEVERPGQAGSGVTVRVTGVSGGTLNVIGGVGGGGGAIAQGAGGRVMAAQLT